MAAGGSPASVHRTRNARVCWRRRHASYCCTPVCVTDGGTVGRVLWRNGISQTPEAHTENYKGKGRFKTKERGDTKEFATYKQAEGLPAIVQQPKENAGGEVVVELEDEEEEGEEEGEATDTSPARATEEDEDENDEEDEDEEEEDDDDN